MTETWKDIPGWEGFYQVSDQGRIKSLSRVNARGFRQKEKIMKNSVDSKGYYYVSLYRDGKRKNHRVHRLVALTFVGEPPNETDDVCHNDGTRTNNQPENLRWGTRSENILDASRVHKTHYMGSKTHCKTGHPLGGDNSDGKDRECLACRRASSTVRYHTDLKTRFREVADIHYENLIGEKRRVMRGDFPF